MKIFMPAIEGELASHFGHARQFACVSVTKDKAVESVSFVEAPPHRPGHLPNWLEQQGADIVVACGIGRKAVTLFESLGIETVVGVKPGVDVKTVAESYLKGTLESSGESCGHHDDHHGHGHSHGHGH